MNAGSQTENRLSARLAAAERLRREADAWVVQKRRLTIAKSSASYNSKVKSYFEFCAFLGEAPLPVREETVMRFIALFANGRSAAGYVTALHWVCDSLGYPVYRPVYVRLDGFFRLLQPWHTRCLDQLVRGTMKATVPTKRAPAIMWDLAIELVRHAWSRGETDVAVAYVFAAVFMLRVANELIPLQIDGMHSKVVESVDKEGRAQIVLHFASRKNRPAGASIRRRCLCECDPSLNRPPVLHYLCPVHALMGWRHAHGNAASGRVFPAMNYSSFIRVLRAHLRALAVPDSHTFTTHGFRRGTAQQMLREGSRLGEILAAGDWRSPAFIQYLEKADVEEAAVLDMLVGKDVKASPDGLMDTFEPSHDADGNRMPVREVPMCRAAPKRQARPPASAPGEERQVVPAAKRRAAPPAGAAVKRRRVIPPAPPSRKITDFLPPR